MEVLAGDGVRFGASTTILPGAIVMPELVLPPRAVLLGTVDARHRHFLMQQFFSTWDFS